MNTLVSDIVYVIREGLGDIQKNRWSDTFIISQLNMACDRLLTIFKRHHIDYGMGRVKITIPKDTDTFTLPTDFAGHIKLVESQEEIELVDIEKFEEDPTNCFAYLGTSLVIEESTEDREFTLLYWKRPKIITTIGETMPYSSLFDYSIANYTRMILQNLDEMNVSQDNQISSNLENSIISLCISRRQKVVKNKGWL